MLLNTAPQDQAILSNVSEIGEFRIRNSAKAFNILSSGLYANKIKAIIRELSCNAVDSHVAAGKTGTPFDVHLPNQMEPWFSIRDYGTGLDHEQVTNIYTTYFESTKTDSNDYIGALGLGSKSPFSYTDNFTVTAVKNGTKNIYSAFINAQGVPSIALMAGEEGTLEPTGVEVKFSVNDSYDFYKFKDEARSVYKFFTLRPVVSGARDFEFYNVEYETRDIIPGVHCHKDSYRTVAVMGNIGYPIDIPNAEGNLGNLRNLLECGLEMHFAIGELDFQASREGLSYIPQTINSIKAKLEAVNNRLATYVKEEAEKIDNLWDRAFYLLKKRETRLWRAAVEQYIVDSKNPFFNSNNAGYVNIKNPEIKIEDLASRYNISVRAFSKSRGYSTVTTVNSESRRADKPNKDGSYSAWAVWPFLIDRGTNFVINDTKIGATERAKHHYRNTAHPHTEPGTKTVYVLEPADKNKPINTKAFFRTLRNPPESTIALASTLMEKERKEVSSRMAKNVTIMRLEERGHGGYYRSQECVWRDAGKADTFDATKTYYYLPLSGYSIVSERFKDWSGKIMMRSIKNSGIEGVNQTIYGVRKTDIEFIKTQKNWVNLEDHIGKLLSKLTPDDFKTLAAGTIDKYSLLQYNENIVKAVSNPNSPYVKVATYLKDVRERDVSESELKSLFRAFDVTLDLTPIVEAITKESADVYDRYPLIKEVGWRVDATAVAEYINLIDEKKGI